MPRVRDGLILRVLMNADVNEAVAVLSPPQIMEGKIAEAPGIREAGAAAALGAGFITWDPANTLVRHGRYPNEPAAKLDHVFFRDGLTARWQAIEVDVVFTRPVDGLALIPAKGAAAVPAQLSDHYGFLATLDLAGTR